VIIIIAATGKLAALLVQRMKLLVVIGAHVFLMLQMMTVSEVVVAETF
jgi:hypothetical protein